MGAMNEPTGLDTDTLATTLAASILAMEMSVEYLTALAIVESRQAA